MGRGQKFAMNECLGFYQPITEVTVAYKDIESLC